MLYILKKLKNSLSVLILVVLIFSIFCSLDYHLVDLSDDLMKTSTILTQNIESVCKHIFSLFINNKPISEHGIFVLSIVFVLLISVRDLFVVYYFRWRYILYIRNNKEFKLFCYLKYLFSDGILNSKKYIFSLN